MSNCHYYDRRVPSIVLTLLMLPLSLQLHYDPQWSIIFRRMRELIEKKIGNKVKPAVSHY